MLPAQWRQVLQQLAVHRFARVAHRLGGALQVHRVPQHDGCRHQVEAAGPVALLLEAPIPDFAEAVEEHRPGQGVTRLALVQPGMHAATQLDALQPVEDEQRALDPAQLAQRHSQAVLARIAAELAQHQRGGDGALLDRAGQAQDVVPMGANVLDVQGAADQWAQRRVALHALRHIQLGFAEVTDTRREAEAQQMHQGEDVIGEAGRVGVVLLDPQVGLVVQQTVEHIGGVAHTDIHHAGAERRVLVGDMGVKQPSRLAAVFRVDVPGALAPAARAETLAIGG